MVVEHGVYICFYIIVSTGGALKAGQGSVKSHLTAEKLTLSGLVVGSLVD